MEQSLNTTEMGSKTAPDYYQSNVLETFVLVILTAVILMPAMAHIMHHLLRRLYNKYQFVHFNIVARIIYNLAPTIPGLVFLALGFAFNYLEVGIMGFTLLQGLFGQSLACWKKSNRLIGLLRKIPSPSCTPRANRLQRASVINDLMKDATTQNHQRALCLEDSVLLCFLHLKAISLMQHHFHTRLSNHTDHDIISLEQNLLRFPAAVNDYNSNLGTFLHDRFSHPFNRLLHVPSVAGTTPAMVNEVESLRILFTIVMFHCIRSGPSAAERRARYWEVMNENFNRSGFLTWFSEFTKWYYDQQEEVWVKPFILRRRTKCITMFTRPRRPGANSCNVADVVGVVCSRCFANRSVRKRQLVQCRSASRGRWLRVGCLQFGVSKIWSTHSSSFLSDS